MTTTSTFASPPAAPLPVSRQVGEILSEILRIHTDPALDGCTADPPRTEKHWCPSCCNTCQVSCGHCGAILMTVSSQHGKCPDCPAARPGRL
jgi:hypothetical protein